MDMAAYDWQVVKHWGLADARRLSYYNLETRDAYFTRLMGKIELMRKHNGRKVVLCSHS